jgi:hypothetical protein
MITNALLIFALVIEMGEMPSKYFTFHGRQKLLIVEFGALSHEPLGTKAASTPKNLEVVLFWCLIF